MLGLPVLRIASIAALLASPTLARFRDGRAHANIPPLPAPPIVQVPSASVTSRNGTELPPLNTTYFFDQLIDHDNPSLGTFKQRFWFSAEFYEPGGAIVLMTPGEANAERMYPNSFVFHMFYSYLFLFVVSDMYANSVISVHWLPHQPYNQRTDCSAAKCSYNCLGTPILRPLKPVR